MARWRAGYRSPEVFGAAGRCREVAGAGGFGFMTYRSGMAGRPPLMDAWRVAAPRPRA
jgi:hypothetical protein